MKARQAGIVATLALAVSCAPRQAPADLVLVGGKIVTMDDDRPEAQALAVRDGRILAVGDDAEIQRSVGPATEVIALEGRLAVPGFVEAHAHFVNLGRLKRALDLRDTRSWSDVLERVRRRAADAAPDEWITGRGWHQEKWAEPVVPSVQGYPTRASLDVAAPRNPVLLKHASGHAVIANSVALAIGGIGSSTPDPPGGQILREASGSPTGILLENAGDALEEEMERALARRPAEAIAADLRRAIDAAQSECLAKGVTTFQDAGASFATIDLYRTLAEEGKLAVRLWVMVGEDNDALRERLGDYRIIGAGDDHLTVRAVKKYIDGALGSRGAWLLEPYADEPASVGLNTVPIPELEEAATLAAEHGFQFAVHAIGDRANRETLDLFERVWGAHPEVKDPRWRIEHVQHLADDDVPRFGKLGIVASMQGIHCTSDGPWVIARIGQARAREGAYVWRKLLDSGAVIANGTDAPVEDLDPIANFHASVTRRLADGSVFFAGERMTRIEALRSQTRDAAYAGFEEHLKGTLAPGMLADVVVLSRDLLTVPEGEILGTRVLYTIVGGEVAHRSP